MLEHGVMRTVSQWVEHLEFIDIDEPSYLGRPLGILVGENPRSLLMDDNMVSL